MRTYPSIGVLIPRVLLPLSKIDLNRWAVVACDQFTSQPDYWQQVSQWVGDSPSTYHMILPEVFLGQPGEDSRIRAIHAAMNRYLDQDFLEPYEGLMLVERSVNGRTRHGLMLALDLEQYDYHQGSQTLIRATEGTIIGRLPPRIKIRQDAVLELPHILVLIDDPACSVIEPLIERKGEFQKVYDTGLMLGSGHLTGYFTNDLTLEHQVVHALEDMANPGAFQAKYGTGASQGVLLFAMGDGNHSFATAKSIWEQTKASVGPDHPARYAMVEIENVHDAGLEFEPIHRVLFNVKGSFQAAMRKKWGDDFNFTPCSDHHEMIATVNQPPVGVQAAGVISTTGCGIVTFNNPTSNLAVGTLQPFLDEWHQAGGYGNIDYVHGDDVVVSLGRQPGNLAFYLPPMPKSDLFKTVILDGALPRKTFSMGEAIEKRFYMESRKIVG